MIPILYFTAVAAILFLALRMTCGACVMGTNDGTGRAYLPVVPLGWALSLFLVLTYLVCIAFDLIFPATRCIRPGPVCCPVSSG